MCNIKKKYTKEEITKLNNNGKCYIIRKNKIYDVTDFIKYHPGGSVWILKNRDKDVDSDYKFHSYNAKKKWRKYFIGYLN